ncbi:fucolectin-6 [Lingula anatina]|uniref:Fucolectin-6 n=1 Tax=Lingula anatina TaxID=7574 RepID=A0A1S3I633_LINAN|nr:fucolectin-6 [Lingula anatina]|eukprot:XP_013393306.1 fucolectin-6 [Lingula anatina]
MSMVALRLLLVGITMIFLGTTPCRGCTQNLAKGKPAYQSSTYLNTYHASRAVDGYYDDNNIHGSFSYTNGSQGDWWLVDLETTAKVAGVIITNRGNIFSQFSAFFLHNFEVRVGTSYDDSSSFNQYKPCASYPGVGTCGEHVSVLWVTTERTICPDH